MYYELQLNPARPNRNLRTGQYLKGHTPANKGKSWDEYMTKRAQRKCAKGWKNLDKYRPKTRPDNAGRCRKKCVAVTDDGKFRIFDYMGAAAQWVGGSRENVRRCCKSNQSMRQLHNPKGKLTNKINTDHKYLGHRFYYFDDPTWWTKTKTNL
jgi:hypothetical protein